MIDTQCPCCDSELRPRFQCVTDPDGGQSFAIHDCQTCGAGRTVPMPSNLDAFYQQYHGGRHGVTTSLCDRRRARFVAASTRIPHGRLLDVGCGDGTFLKTIQSKGWVACGTELDPDRLRALGLDVFPSMDQLPDGITFDCVTLWHSLEHFRDPNTVFASIAKIIESNGTVLIAVPNYGGSQARLFGRHWLHLDVPRHLTHFTMRSLEVLASRHDMVATRLRGSEFEYDLMGWIQSALNACGFPPNLLLKMMMHRRPTEPFIVRTVCLALGFGLGTIALLPTLLGCIGGRGDTLVVRISQNKETER